MGKPAILLQRGLQSTHTGKFKLPQISNLEVHRGGRFTSKNKCIMLGNGAQEALNNKKIWQREEFKALPDALYVKTLHSM